MTEPPIDLAERTRTVYDRQAETYDAHRSRALHESRWLTRFADALPPKGTILDLGCGTGRPLAGWLIAEGFALTGADFSEPMLALARERWPDGDWRLADMRTLDFPERFDGIIGWDSFFHLTPDEQRACLPRLAKHLAPGGTLMVTVGPEAGEVTGTVGGENGISRKPVAHGIRSAPGRLRPEDDGLPCGGSRGRQALRADGAEGHLRRQAGTRETRQ